MWYGNSRQESQPATDLAEDTVEMGEGNSSPLQFEIDRTFRGHSDSSQGMGYPTRNGIHDNIIIISFHPNDPDCPYNWSSVRFEGL